MKLTCCSTSYITKKYYAKKQNKTKNAAHVAVMWTKPKNKRTTQTVNVSEQTQRKICYDVDSTTKLKEVSNNRHKECQRHSQPSWYTASLHISMLPAAAWKELLAIRNSFILGCKMKRLSDARGAHSYSPQNYIVCVYNIPKELNHYNVWSTGASKNQCPSMQSDSFFDQNDFG